MKHQLAFWTKPPDGARKRFAKMIQTFFADAAVLLFLFPALDGYVQHEGTGVPPLVIVLSLGASVMCLTIAGVLAVYTDEPRLPSPFYAPLSGLKKLLKSLCIGGYEL